MAVSRVFAEFDGIRDAQLWMDMTNEQVQQLILSTDLNAAEAAATAAKAAAASPLSPSESAAPPSLAESAATADSSHARTQTAFMTYNWDGKQVVDRTYRGDT